ncbi:hypothetical protein RHS02_09674, partial [Rhizoctonia solani]
MSDPLQLPFQLSFFFHLLHGPAFLSMGPLAIAALGAGAFVTTAVAGVILLHRKVFTKSVQVDTEQGLSENALERREGTGPGWKEFTEEDEKATTSISELLLPLFPNQESDIGDTLAKGPQVLINNPLRGPPGLLSPGTQQRANSVLVPEGDISDTRDWGDGPVFPPGLPLPANVAVATPILASSNRPPYLSPLDTGVSGIALWPILAPTPAEEIHCRANGQEGKVNSILTEKPGIKDDVVPQDEPSSSSSRSGQHLTVSSITMIPASTSIHEPEKRDPNGDPTDLAHHPCSEVPLAIDVTSPTRTPRSTIISLDKVNQSSQYNDTGWPGAGDPAPRSPLLCTVPGVTVPGIPLPESLPLSPKAVSSLLIHTLPLDAIATTTTVFIEELSPWVDVSDYESPNPVAMPFVPVLPPIVTALRTDKDCNEAPRSPLSDAGSSSSDSESSGPDTPTELKHDLPFGAGPGNSFKGPPEPHLPVDSMERDVSVEDDVEIIDDFVIVGHQAPDPPTPTTDYPSTEWTPSTLPGSFGKATAPSDNSQPDQKSVYTMTVTDPPLTADMVQLCHALLAVSNCAGHVAQLVVGASTWWSLSLVPT